MFDLIYAGFFLLMVAEMLLFLFLNLPFSKSWKATIHQYLAASKFVRTFVKIQIVLCILVVIFYVDLHRTEQIKSNQKRKLKDRDTIGAQMRRSRLSFEVIKLQRNKYVGFIVVFTFTATMVFFWIKNKRYALERHLQQLEDAHHPHTD